MNCGLMPDKKLSTSSSDFDLAKKFSEFFSAVFDLLVPTGLGNNDYNYLQSQSEASMRLEKFKKFLWARENRDKYCINNIFIGLAYDDNLVQKLIKNAKFGGQWGLVKNLVAAILGGIKTSISQEKLKIPEAIFFIPADPKRGSKRGYHLPEQIAKELASKLVEIEFFNSKIDFQNEPSNPNPSQITISKIQVFCPIIKTKSTKSQVGLVVKNGRLRNLEGVFGLSDKLNLAQLDTLKNLKYIWLVDDVISTGTTLGEVAIEIKKHFPNIQIDSAVLAG